MKFAKLIPILLLGSILIACSSTNKPAEKGIDTDEVKTDSSQEKKDFPAGDYKELGDGAFYISTPSGSSEGENIPILYSEEDALLVQIGYEAEGIDGSLLSYIYIDGMLIGKEQLSDTQGTLDLSREQLLHGIHTVEVVQYKEDDIGKDIVLYKTASFEVKGK